MEICGTKKLKFWELGLYGAVRKRETVGWILTQAYLRLRQQSHLQPRDAFLMCSCCAAEAMFLKKKKKSFFILPLNYIKINKSPLRMILQYKKNK